jgi:hypothetical protein
LIAAPMAGFERLIPVKPWPFGSGARPRQPRRLPPLHALSMLAIAAMLALWPAAAGAQALACAADGTDPVVVAKVTADLDIALKDGRIVRLVGLRMPAGTARPSPGLLAGWIADAGGSSDVRLRPFSPIADRWGRIAADIFVAGRHLQSALAEKGLGVAAPDDPRGPCWASLKAAEASARRAAAGLWGDKASILDATDGQALDAHDGLFILASGRVRHVSHGKGHRRSYVDFGRRGENALFLTIDAKALTRMEKLGFKLEQLAGRAILVRGVVSRGRAPHMVVDDIDAIDFWE